MKTVKKPKGHKRSIGRLVKSSLKFIPIGIIACTLSLVFVTPLLQNPSLDYLLDSSIEGKFIIVDLVALVLGFFLYKLWKTGVIARRTISIVSLAGIIYLPFIAYWMFGVFFVRFMSLPDVSETTPGTENATLIQNTSGSIVYENESESGRDGGITYLSLPGRTEKKVALNGKIESLGGPDTKERIVYFIGGSRMVPNDYTDKYEAPKQDEGPFQLIRYSLSDGKKEIIFSLKKPVYMYPSHMYGGLSLSPSGERVAFVSNLAIPGETYGNESYESHDKVAMGKLEVWDLGTKKQIPLDLQATESTIAWISEESFYYTKVVNDVEQIYLYDLSTKKDTYYANGANPVLSPDAKSLIYSKSHQVYLVNLESNTSEQIALPGILNMYDEKAILGFVGHDKVLYLAAMTQEEKNVFKKKDKELARLDAYPSTFKISDLKTGEFQTVVKEINSYAPASLGY